jgi:hypothetical protein
MLSGRIARFGGQPFLFASNSSKKSIFAPNDYRGCKSFLERICKARTSRFSGYRALIDVSADKVNIHYWANFT